MIWKLFGIFFKIGLFTFGGGYAMIPMIQKELSEKRGWLGEEDLLDILAIAEITPGPIAVNAATFMGKKLAGFWGAFMATLGVVLPSFLVISVISHILGYFMEFRAVQYAFFGVRAAVIALIIRAVVFLFSKVQKDVLSLLIMICVFALATFLKINVIFLIIGSALIGIVAALLSKKVPGENEEDAK